MKVLIHGYFGWYGSMAEWIKASLIGHEVVTCIDRSKKANSSGYDLYLIVDCSEDYSDNISPKTDAVAVYWSMDAHMPMGLDRVKNMTETCDFVVSSNDEHGVRLLEQNGIHSTLIPITYVKQWTPDRRIPLRDRKYDIAMIGHMNSPERALLWRHIHDVSNNVFTGRANTLEQYIDIMSNSKIVINQPTEPWSIILNNRFFEALGFGTLLLQKRLQTSLIDQLGYKNQRHFIYWSDINEIREMSRAILGDIDLYENIAKRGNILVQKDSIEKQVAKLLSLINSQKPSDNQSS